MNRNISLTENAVQVAKQLMNEDQNKGLNLRLYIEGKGCDGFYYGVTFSERQEADLSFQQEDVLLLIDQETYQFCEGSIIDWVDDERGKGFLVDNPHHKKFRGKFFKRKSWTEKLESQNTNRQ